MATKMNALSEISVIVPAYNVAPYISETLDSVLRQDKAAFELILIDDGSTDDTLAIMRDYQKRFACLDRRCLVVTQNRGGAGAARNEGMRLASGQYFCFLDADDILYPDALSLLAAQLRDETGCDLVFPLCRHIDRNGMPTGVVSKADGTRYSAEDLLANNPIHSGSGVVLQANRAREVGLFDTTLPACIDVDYWVRICEGRGSSIRAVDRILVDYRARPGQLTGNWRRMRNGRERVIENARSRGICGDRAFTKSARARSRLLWATAAYKTKDYSSARRLMLECWLQDPMFAVKDWHARVRTAAVLTTILPRKLHRLIETWFNNK